MVEGREAAAAFDGGDGTTDTGGLLAGETTPPALRAGSGNQFRGCLRRDGSSSRDAAVWHESDPQGIGASRRPGSQDAATLTAVSAHTQPAGVPPRKAAES